MRTLVIQTLEAAQGSFPKINMNNYKLMSKTGRDPVRLIVRANTHILVGKGLVMVMNGVTYRQSEKIQLADIIENKIEVSLEPSFDAAFFYMPKNVRQYVIIDWNASVFNKTSSLTFDYENYYLNNDMVDITYVGRHLSFGNPAIENWDTSGIRLYRGALMENKQFDRPIGKWNMKNAEQTSYMFMNMSFNEDITDWNMENNLDMGYMFLGSGFNQDISKWTFNKEVNLTAFLNNSSFSPENLSKLYIKLAEKDWTERTKSKVFGASSVKYNRDGIVARQSLVDSGWTIIDGGLV